MNKKYGLLVLGLMLLANPACTKKHKKEIWIYTSMYKDMIEMMRPDVDKHFPDLTIKWFAAGSEKVAAKINAEISAKNLNADILMTSDPFYYQSLKGKGLLLAYEPENAKNIPAYLKDTDHAFTTQRVPVVVMAYNRNMLRPDQAPKTFKELTEKKWEGKVAMGSPLESGTTFTAVATLSAKYGWDFFKKLRANNVVSAGGNSSVRRKLEAKEYPVGIILLENILHAKKQGSPLEPIYPEDGMIMVPSPVAIFNRTLYPNDAKRVVDYLFSEAGQKWMVKAYMYSPNPVYAPPVGAKTFGYVLKQAFPWNQKFVSSVLESHHQIKEQFTKIMFE